MRVKDYNAIKWDDYFYLDETSPSGLRWKVDRMCGKSNAIAKIKSGSIAGSIQCNKLGKSKRWSVGFEDNYYRVHRIIFILVYGSIDNSKVIDHLDGDGSNNSIENLAIKSQRTNNQNSCIYANNTSGIAGIHLMVNHRGNAVYKNWTVRWNDAECKRLSKSFSVNKYGHNEAFTLAVAYRIEQIKLLNETGQCYTDRHIYNKLEETNESS